MFISTISGPWKYPNNVPCTKTTTIGKLPNGHNISISNFIEDGQVKLKQYRIWDGIYQRVIHKARGLKGFVVLA